MANTAPTTMMATRRDSSPYGKSDELAGCASDVVLSMDDVNNWKTTKSWRIVTKVLCDAEIMPCETVAPHRPLISTPKIAAPGLKQSQQIWSTCVLPHPSGRCRGAAHDGLRRAVVLSARDGTKADDLIDKEVEELMLRESDDAIAGLQAQVAGLTEQVRQLKDQAPQVSNSNSHLLTDIVLNVETTARGRAAKAARVPMCITKEEAPRLEKPSRKAYPDMTERELSTLRSGKLITQLTTWPACVQLFTVLEQAPSEEAYGKLKSLAQRVERSRHVAESLKRGTMEKTRQSDSQGTNATGPLRSSLIGTNGKPQGQSLSQGIPKDSTPAQRKTEVVCHKCKKPGYLRRDCRESVQTPAEQARPGLDITRKRQPQPQNKPRTFQATLGTRSCSTHHKEDEESVLTGPQTVTEVELLGQKTNALLDTGSQISILPLELLQKAADSGFDLDNDVEEIPNVDRVPIFNASGNQIVFKGAVRLTVAVDGGSKRRVAFFVLKGGDGILVLGTNVLKSLGYELQRPRAGLSEQNVTEVQQLRTTEAGAKCRPRRAAKAQRTKSDNLVKVVSRLYMKPGETKTIEL
ncbi:unnamed protein product [Heligmosomoides polygyrus]|uniref:CCHC-type domain-containing protein n=1 Tax=Heligmosomoides polygyrus TaxID=6339 RepID=A0A183FJK4_HELPZ|nr:unnamed protein product [Heligmosomoides polygyrus]